MSVLLTIGHSNHTLEHFFKLLIQYEVQYLIDVRSHPYSKFAPQFNSEVLKMHSRMHGIRYVYFGKELGGRPKHEDQYDKDGKALYYKMAQESSFTECIERLKLGSAKNLLALMCSEENPTYCHRRLLIARSLYSYSIDFFHIRGNGYLQPEIEISSKNPLIPLQEDMFSSEDLEWKSFQSVLRKPQQKDFFLESERMASSD